ncbi:MAG: 50S ribosomal protein L6 [Candidatus Eisenbacteria bacterium]|uniref:Large ribosomal subunit protein uL6 n=1 Tax=Eiseniibacteriota bacterium TaxID=2212470 RepID=A0A9D6L6W5_UNCEI|nr:50S ribosomal protein L6 [Candidatus Eisenbacteria bacterium]MBI3538939.1 50S ribosomal protein L6 [Candidatus Eisenbacteria bacterium]
MSRMGKRPVPVPSGVTVAVEGGAVRVKGPKGELSVAVLEGTTVTVEGDAVKVDSERKTRNPAFGTMRAHIANMVTGVTGGFSKTLEIVGTGYRAAMEGKVLVLQLGYSHPIRFEPPAGITIKVENPTRLTISGADKWAVGQSAAEIRGFRPPEPYKGKGIKYEGEYIRRKAGKAAGTTTS